MNNKFFKSAFILSIGGALTKIIGLFIKIIYTRIIGLDGVSLLSIINPTYSMLITLASFNILIATSVRISSNIKARKVMVNSCYIMFFLNAIMTMVMFLIAPFISNSLLHNSDAKPLILAATLSLPFVSLGYVIKGYFYGKQNVLPHMISNVLEQVFRLIIISLFLPKLVKYGTVVMVTVLLLFNVLTESFSIVVLYLFLPRDKNIKKEDLKFDGTEAKEILKITIPSISGRILGNIGFFLEPILLTNVLLSKGCSSLYITREYGIYNGYVIGTLLFPSFIVSALANSLLPEITNSYVKKDYGYMKKRIKEAIIFSLILGIGATTFVFLGADIILKVLYNTSEGVNYIRILAPFFILFYIESPLSTILTAINKVKISTVISTTGIIFKLIIMVILGWYGFKIYALILAEIFNIVYVTLFNYYFVRKYVG